MFFTGVSCAFSSLASSMLKRYFLRPLWLGWVLFVCLTSVCVMTHATDFLRVVVLLTLFHGWWFLLYLCRFIYTTPLSNSTSGDNHVHSCTETTINPCFRSPLLGVSLTQSYNLVVESNSFRSFVKKRVMAFWIWNTLECSLQAYCPTLTGVRGAAERFQWVHTQKVRNPSWANGIAYCMASKTLSMRFDISTLMCNYAFCIMSVETKSNISLRVVGT